MKRIVLSLLLILVLVMSSVSMAFADADPYINIVNPSAGATINSSNLLVSVKVTNEETITVEVAKETDVVSTVTGANGVQETKITKTYTNIAEKEKFTSTTKLSYYTKKFENVKPGFYRITVKTLDGKGNVVYTTTRTVTMGEKEAAVNGTYTTNQSGTLTFLTNLLKTIFGNS